MSARIIALACSRLGMTEHMWLLKGSSIAHSVSMAGRQEAEELFETVSQCLQSGSDRDALSGWGAVVFVMCALPTL